MAAVSIERLSFDHDLRHAYTPCLLRLQCGAKSLDGVLEILRMRIDAEISFTNNLQKIIGCSTNLISTISSQESIRRDGLDALYSDLKNEYIQRMSFLQSLRDDVHNPLSKMKQFYYTENKKFTNQTKSNIQSLKKQQNEFLKLKAKYDKIMKPNNGDKILNNKSKKQQLLNIKKKYQQQQIIWKKQQQIFDNKMISTLQSMESNEYKRMNSMRDAITNWSAYITNLAANRSYDIQNLAKSMALINVENDLQNFMKQTLIKYPSPSTKETINIQNAVIGANNNNHNNNNNMHYLPQQKNTISAIMLPNLKKQPSTDYVNLFKQKFSNTPKKMSLSSSSIESGIISTTPTSTNIIDANNDIGGVAGIATKSINS